MTFTKLRKYVVVSVWMVDSDAQLCEWPGKRYLWRQRSDEKWQYHHIRILVRESSRDRRPWKHCRGTFPGVCREGSVGDFGAKSKEEKEKGRWMSTQIHFFNSRTVSSESSLGIFWKAKDAKFFRAKKEDWTDCADTQADLSLRRDSINLHCLGMHLKVEYAEQMTSRWAN